MRAPFLTWLSILLAAPALSAGCLSADQVALVIVSTEPVAGAPPPDLLRVRIFEVETGQQVVSQTVNSAEGSIAGLGALRTGVAYALAFEAQYASGTCADDRAVGVSTPFVHREGGYSIPIQVGCADEFGRTLSQPIEARLAAGLATAIDGTAVLAGGVPDIELRTDLEVTEVVPLVERYAPFAGGFAASGTMLTARAFPALQAVPQGGVAVFGGVVPGLPECEATVELIVGSASTATGALGTPRCFADAALLPAVSRLVVGGGSRFPAIRLADFEAFDLNAQPLADSGFEGLVYREAPRFVALGDGQTMLAIGGVDAMSGGPVVEAVHFGDRCPQGGAPCTVRVPAAGLDQQGLIATAATYLECPDGGGTVYITGGITGAQDANRALDQILCIREEPDPAEMRVVRAGTLPEPRARHEMVVVRGTMAPRLLIVGGGRTTSITSNLLDDALLVPVDPCACVESSPQVLERIPLPFTGSAIFHQLTTLQDGSVLLV
ncbi:MAG: hypothetical protein KJN97_16350, partial [Deltaproteobacteria bacterium]|nr:hypothetical protein [Deltaproteobacteria bacterium]